MDGCQGLKSLLCVVQVGDVCMEALEMFGDSLQEFLNAGMVMCCGEIIMDQLIIGGDGGGESCWVRAIPLTLCDIILAWFQFL